MRQWKNEDSSREMVGYVEVTVTGTREGEVERRWGGCRFMLARYVA